MRALPRERSGNMAYEALDFFDIDSLLTDEERMVRDMVRDLSLIHI